MNLKFFYLARAIGFIVVLVLVLLYFYFFKSTPAGNENVNENNSSAELTDWLTFEDKEQNISFPYPESFTTSYMSLVTWPPKVSVSDMAYNCPVTEATSSLPDRTTERKVDNRTYCVTATSEGAVGSVFTDYTYSTVRDGKLINISFALRYPQCYNYDDSEKSACEGERETFDLDSIIDKIAQNVR